MNRPTVPTIHAMRAEANLCALKGDALHLEHVIGQCRSVLNTLVKQHSELKERILETEAQAAWCGQ